MEDSVLRSEIALIPRELLQDGREIQNQLGQLDHEIIETEGKLRSSESRLRSIVTAEVGVVDHIGLTHGKDPRAPELRVEEETTFEQLQAKLGELMEERRKLVMRIRTQFIEVQLRPGTFDLREPSRQL